MHNFSSNIGNTSFGSHPLTRLNALISEINHVSSVMDGLQLDYIFAALMPKFVAITVSNNTKDGNQPMEVQRNIPAYQTMEKNTQSKGTKTIFVEMTDELTMSDALTSLSALYSYRETLFGEKYQLVEGIEQAEKKEYKITSDNLYFESIANSQI